MFDTETLTNQLSGKVALYAGFDAGSDKVKISRPLVHLSDAHKLLRPDIINALGPYVEGVSPQPYDADATYNQFELVNDSDVVYQSVTPENSGHALSDATYWQKTTVLSAWYSQIERGAIAKLSLALAGTPSGVAVLSRQAIFNREGNLQGAIGKNGRFLGWRIRIQKTGVLFNIARSGLQLTGPAANVPIYLFHSSSAVPVAVAYLTGTTSGRTIWADSPNFLLKQSDGYYLLGYFESDLPVGVQAVGSERSFATASCSSCQGADYALAANRQKYVTIEPVYVDDADTPGVMDWADENSVALQTWGLNLIIEVHCDRTKLLANTLLYMIACDVLEELSTSDRLNGISAQLRNSAYIALYGQANSKVTDGALSTVRNNALAELKGAMASTDCGKVEAPRRGIRFESMFD
ncbi:hypothetical protein [Spirosoma flavum]|uniref:Uncharacterized protein n=1 Tax=Spirosoma flavum TaxID=2048557 RepID=A0ABW6ALE0_9BACT